jgi:hypothetical protein
MCHFLFAMIFPVIDNKATGIFEYEFYWRGMKDAWQRFPLQEQARAQLNAEIITTGPIHPSYPWETKIIELSHIGYAQG